MIHAAYSLILVAALAGCTKGVPTFEELSSLFGAPTPDHSIYEITDLAATVTISGAYHPSTESFKHRIQNLGVYADFGAGAITFANQRFDLVLGPIGTYMGFTPGLPEDRALNLQAIATSQALAHADVVIRYAYSTTPMVSILSASATEGQTLAFTVSLSAVTGVPVTFTHAVYDGSAAATDWTQLESGAITIPALTLTKTLYVHATHDEFHEGDETVTLSLSALANATFSNSTATGTIIDNDPAPGIFVADATAVTEGGTSTFLVSLSALSYLDATFAYQTLDGTAVSTQDYVAAGPAPQTIPAGSLTYAFKVVTTDDNRDEAPTEAFQVTLTAVLGATAIDVAATGVINDNDLAPLLFIDNQSASEGETLQFVVSISEISDVAVGFNYSTVNGSAVAPDDFGSVANVAGVIPAGSLTTSVPVVTSEESLLESAEQFGITLTNLVNARVGDTSAEGIITNDDSGPQIVLADAAAVTEGGTALFVVTLTETSGLPVSFDYWTSNGTATLTSDYYQALATTVTIPAGALSLGILVETVNDARDESPTEFFTLDLGGAVNATFYNSQAQANINDNDDPPQIFIDSTAATEGETLNFTVSLSSVSDLSVSFAYTTYSGLATSGLDFNPYTPGAGTIAAGSLWTTVPVESLQESMFENSETFSVTLSGLSNTTGGVVGAVGTIIADGDPAPVIDIYDLSISEGFTGTFAISLSALSEVEAVFKWRTYDGTGSAPADYSAVADTFITIPALQVQALVQVVTQQDVLNESAEAFTVSLAAPSGATLGDYAALGTIVDDDGPPVVNILGAATVTEGAASIFTVTLSAVSALDVVFSYQTYDNTAISGQDFVAIASGTGTIPAGQLTFAIPVVTIDDSRDEIATEYVTVSLAAGVLNGTDGILAADGGIDDNDDPPEIFIGDAAATEGGTLLFEVTVSAASELNVDFNFQTYDGLTGSPALAPGDYTAVGPSPGQIVAGGLAFTIAVSSLQDDIDEPSEGLRVSLSAPVNGTIGTDLGLGAVLDDDSTPLLSVTNETVSEGDLAVLTVSLDRPSASEITFIWDTSNGTALAPGDYGVVAGGVGTIAPLALTVALNLGTTEDTTYEPAEEFYVQLSAPVSAVGSPLATVAISDDDAPPDIFISDEAVTEGGTLSFNVSLSEVSGLDVIVEYSSSDGTAALADSDYIGIAGQLTILAGELGGQVSLRTTVDAKHEGNETVTVDLTSHSNADPGDVTGTGTIGNDDSEPKLYIADVSLSEGSTFVFTVTLDAPSGLPVTFDLETGDQSATIADGDYSAVTMPLVIPAGSWSVAGNVTTTHDTKYEPEETFVVNLTSVLGAGAGDLAATATIGNDDISPTLYLIGNSAAEGDPINIVASLSAVSGVPVEFTWRTYEDTATASDYTGVGSSTHTLTPGQQTIVLAVVTTEDLTHESPMEDFVVSISSVTDATNGSLAGVDGIITDDDSLPEIRAVDADPVVEGAVAIFTVTLSHDSAFAVEFDYQTLDGSALASHDYVSVSARRGTITPGNLTLAIAVTTSDDSRDEPVQSFTLTLANPTQGTILDGSGSVNISDNDSKPLIYISDAAAVEGGTTEFLISLTEISDFDVNFDFSSHDGIGVDRAMAPGDFSAVGPLPLQISAGGLSLTAGVVTVDDTVYENSERLTVSLTGLVNATGGDVTGEGSITNADAAPTLAIYDLTILEGDADSVAVSLSALSEVDAVFEWQTFVVTADASDFTPVSATWVTISAGQTQSLLPVATTEDSLVEGSETFEVSLASPSAATLADAGATVTIADDDALPLLSIYDAADAAEGAPAQFVVSLSATYPTDVTFNYRTFDDTAAAPGDYADIGLLQGTVPAGSLTAVLQLITLDDTWYDSDPTEYFRVSLSALVNADPSAWPLQASGGILDDEAEPVVYIMDAAAVTEGETLEFTVSITHPSDSAVTFNYSTIDGSGISGATSPADFGALLSDPGAIPSGSLTHLIRVVTEADDIFEQQEGLTATLTAIAGALPGVLVGSALIDDDDLMPVLAAYTITVTEGAVAPVVVSLSHRSSQEVVFTWVTMPVSASSGVDYTAVGPTAATIPAMALAITLSVATLDDPSDEPNETVNVDISGVTGASGLPTPQVMILDNDDAPFLYISDASVAEGGSLAFEVSLSAASGFPVDFGYSTADGTALTADSDYVQIVAGADGFAPGQLTIVVYVQTNQDTKYEDDEALTVDINSPTNASIGDGSGTGTITADSDPMPALAIFDAAAFEGDVLIFALSLDAVSGVDVEFQWQALDDTATADDYGAGPPTALTIPGGQVAGSITVQTNPDGVFENDEIVKVTLTSPVNVTFADQVADGTISNDDSQPTITIDDISFVEGTSGLLRVYLSTSAGADISVTWSTYDLTTDSSDLNPVVSATITISAGQTFKDLVLTSPNDVDKEGDEHFVVSLTGSGILDDTAEGTITDNDGLPLIFVDDLLSITEGGTAQFIVRLDEPYGHDVTFSYETLDDTAEQPSDYTALALSSGTIVAGSIDTTIAVVTNDDNRDEVGQEYFTLSLSALTNLVPGDLDGDAAIDDNDSAPQIDIYDAEVTEGGVLQFKVSLSALSELDVSFSYETLAGASSFAATSPADFGALTVSGAQIPAETETVLVTVNTEPDGLFEESEDMRVKIYGLVNAAAGARMIATGVIADDDAAAKPTLSVYDSGVTEGGTATFVVSLSQVSGVYAEFDLHSYTQTASGSDFNTASQYGHILPAGALTVAVSVPTIQDMLYEYPETFQVSLVPVSYVNAGDLEATGTINDDDSPPMVSVLAGPSVSEGIASDFAVSLSELSGRETAVNYGTADGSADFASDYGRVVTGVATIPAGSMLAPIQVATDLDGVYEGSDEYFDLTLSSPVNAVLGIPVAQGQIVDVDPMPQIFIGDASDPENGGALVFSVTISGPTQNDVSFMYSTVDISAVDTADYTGANAAPGLIGAGGLSTSISIALFDDGLNEAEETFAVTLGSLTDAQPGRLGGVGTIIDNEPSLISVDSPIGAEGTTLNFNVGLDLPSPIDVVFNYQTYDGTALAGNGDYAGSSGTATIFAGNGSTDIGIWLPTDALYELQETFTLSISSVANATVGSDSGTGTINSIDPRPSLFIGDVEAVEGETLAFLVSITAVSGVNAVITYSTQDGTNATLGGALATASGADYTGSSGTATIPAGSVSMTIKVATLSDLSYENLENLRLIATPDDAHVVVADGTGIGFIHNDDCPAGGWCQQSYLKPPNPSFSSGFGQASAISGDTIVIGANAEDSNWTGVINGTGASFNSSLADSGAAYVFKRADSSWTQQAYLKAGDRAAFDSFGNSAAISGDTVVIGAPAEDSSFSGVSNGTGGASGAGASNSGAAYVFKRTGSLWAQQAYLKAADPMASDIFGYSPAISGDTVVIGAHSEDSSFSGVSNGTGGASGAGASNSGAAYVFKRTGDTWAQEAFLKAAEPATDDFFGTSSAISGDTIVIGAAYEDSNFSGVINGTGEASGAGLGSSGAAYVFRRTGTTWAQEAFLKAAGPVSNDLFGYSSAISGDTIVIGAYLEGSSYSGVINGTGDGSGAGSLSSGAAYVFKRAGTSWAQEAYLKAASPALADNFGNAVAISGDAIAVAAYLEDSNLTMVLNGPADSVSADAAGAGAVYIFKRDGGWTQQAYIKASNTRTGDRFGHSLSISGNTLVATANFEDSPQAYISNKPWSSVAFAFGAPGDTKYGAAYVYKFRGSPSVIIRQASTQSDPTNAFPIEFDVEFSNKIDPATFVATDITQAGSATGVTWSISNFGDDRHFLLQATAGSDGTYIPLLAGGVVTDSDGFLNLASSSNFDNSVTYAIGGGGAAPDDFVVTGVDSPAFGDSVPNDFLTAPGFTSFKVHWTTAFNDPVTYTIELKEMGGAPICAPTVGAPVNEITLNSGNCPGLPSFVNGNQYRIYVSATNPSGTTYATNSGMGGNGYLFTMTSVQPGVFKILGVSDTVDPEKDAYYFDTSFTNITISWENVEGETGYEVAIKDINASSTFGSFTIGADVLTHTFTSPAYLNPGTSYTVVVTANSPTGSRTAINGPYPFHVAQNRTMCPSGLSGKPNRITATNPANRIYDPGGTAAYPNATWDCWLELVGTPGFPISIKNLSFGSAKAADKLKVFSVDAASMPDPVLSGDLGDLLDDYNSTTATFSPRSSPTSGSMTIHWNQDGNPVGAGYEILAKTETPRPGAFTITGIKGGLDNTADQWFTDFGMSPSIHWTSSSGASSYELVIRDIGNSVTVCTRTNIPSNSQDLASVPCSLTNGASYRVYVTAFGGGFESTYASNSNFVFTVHSGAPTPFAITGIVGGADIILDNYLTHNGAGSLVVHWGDVVNETSFEVEIFDNIDTSICGPYFAASDSTSRSIALGGGCNLIWDTHYKIQVTAIDGSGHRTNSIEGRYLFRYGPIPCPTNYVLVPADAAVGVGAPFCVAKYEMKNSGGPASEPTGTPWVSITQANAKTACQTLGGNYDLIKNEEWMAIARNIEQTAANWSSGTVNSGALNTGHSDGAAPVGTVLAASSDDDASCIDTGQSCYGTWNSQSRTHKLNNGGVIWDLAGNASEWVDKIVTNDKPVASTWSEINSVAGTGALPENLFRPITSALTSAHGIGQMYSGADGTNGYMARGGPYNQSAGRAGIYNLQLDPSNIFTSTTLGFRCVYHP